MGKRLHLSDGPIDIVLQAFGATSHVHEAYRAAADRFLSVLDELCAELPLLREPVFAGTVAPTGRIARRMFYAVLPYAANVFITPMAAVAGAVAEEILHSMDVAAPGIVTCLCERRRRHRTLHWGWRTLFSRDG